MLENMDVDIFPKILVWLVPTLPAIVIHEYAHGWMASKLGDPTARDAGRLSLNPLRHIDPVGTIIVPCLMIFAHLPFVFGWAKPVPVNFRRLRNIRVGTMLVALAGPLSNALMTLGWLALLWIIAASAVFNSSPQAAPPLLAQIAVTGAVVNLALILFNLLPIPPLDGGRFFRGRFASGSFKALYAA